MEEAGARDEEEEDNRLVILPTLGILTRLRQQNVFMAPRSLTALSAPCCPPEVRWRRYNSHSERGGGTGGRLVSPERGEKINSRANQWQVGAEPRPPPACSAPCLCVQSEQAAA